MYPLSIEVVIKDGKIEPLDPQQPLPANGRGWLELLPSEKASNRPELVIETNEAGLPVVRATGVVITSEMVKRLDESTW